MVRSRAHSKSPTPCAARLVAAYLQGITALTRSMVCVKACYYEYAGHGTWHSSAQIFPEAL